jgi:hypothetical protein
MARSLLVLVAIGLVGCTESPAAMVDAGPGDSGARDAGGGDPGADAGVDVGTDSGADVGIDAPMIDAGVDADLVLLTAVQTYAEDSTTITVPPDWTMIAPDLSVQTSATTLSAPISPMAIDANTRGFAGVPPGATFYVRHDNSLYIVTNQRVVDDGLTFTGRPSPAISTVANTAVELQVTGATPWQPNDVLELDVSNNSAYFYLDTPSLPTPIATGAVDIDEVVPWSGQALIDATQMDRLRVFHVAQQPSVMGATIAALVEEFAPAAFTVADDGATHTVAGAFVATPRSHTESGILWDVPSFEAMRSSMGPALTSDPGQHSIAWQALPDRPASSFPVTTTVDLYTAVAGGPAALSLGAVQYATPYPIDTVLRSVSVTFRASWRLPTATMASAIQTFFGYFSYEEHDSSNAIQPLVLPPTSPMVNTSVLTGPTDGTGTLPDVNVNAPVVLSWTAPTTGHAPQQYIVSLYQGYLVGGATRGRRIAEFVVDVGTSIIVPPALLTTGSYYRILVTSAWTGSTTAQIPIARAMTASSFFHTVAM